MVLLIRPPRIGKLFRLQAFSFILILQACVPSQAQRTESLRAFIRENLYSTEHLAFGADPRAVNAARSRTTEKDIPVLITLLSDPTVAIVRVAQQVLVTYNDTALPHLTAALDQHPAAAPVLQETIEMIQKRKTP